MHYIVKIKCALMYFLAYNVKCKVLFFIIFIKKLYYLYYNLNNIHKNILRI